MLSWPEVWSCCCCCMRAAAIGCMGGAPAMPPPLLDAPAQVAGDGSSASVIGVCDGTRVDWRRGPGCRDPASRSFRYKNTWPLCSATSAAVLPSCIKEDLVDCEVRKQGWDKWFKHPFGREEGWYSAGCILKRRNTFEPRRPTPWNRETVHENKQILSFICATFFAALTLSLVQRSAPDETSQVVAASWPPAAATCSAVQPSFRSLGPSNRVPAATRPASAVVSPRLAASERAVRPELSAALMSAPKPCTRPSASCVWPLTTAAINGVWPSCERNVSCAPEWVGELPSTDVTHQITGVD